MPRPRRARLGSTPRSRHAMKTSRRMALALVALCALTACNTIAGIGKDVKRAGEVVSETAEDCKNGCGR